MGWFIDSALHRHDLAVSHLTVELGYTACAGPPQESEKKRQCGKDNHRGPAPSKVQDRCGGQVTNTRKVEGCPATTSPSGGCVIIGPCHEPGRRPLGHAFWLAFSYIAGILDSTLAASSRLDGLASHVQGANRGGDCVVV